MTLGDIFAALHLSSMYKLLKTQCVDYFSVMYLLPKSNIHRSIANTDHIKYTESTRFLYGRKLLLSERKSSLLRSRYLCGHATLLPTQTTAAFFRITFLSLCLDCVANARDNEGLHQSRLAF